jgi:glutamate/tyrosine decarboxylase-like PLP-dependent enzyme
VYTPTLRHLFHPDNIEGYLDAISAGADHLAATMSGVTGPSAGTTPAEAAAPVADIDLDVPTGGVDDALTELSRVYLDEAVWFHEPTYAAHLNCPVVIPALLAELFVSSVNSSMDTFDQSVGGTQIERRLIDWTATRIGLPTSAAPGRARVGTRADGIFTSGGTQSNLQALMLARDTALSQPDVESDRLRVLVSEDGHFSVQKAAVLLGLSAEAVVTVPSDDAHRLRVDLLEDAVQRCVDDGLVPMAVVATAGTTDFGAIDPLRRVAAVCERFGTWFHVDAAYGGGLLASRRRRHLLDGIELADSVTIDFHKTWFLPVSASAVIVRDASTLGHLTHHADYLNPAEATDPNQVDKSLQTTRRFDALKLWMALRIMGPDTIGDYFDAAIDLAQEVYDAMGDLPDLEVAAAPSLSTLVFRYCPERLEVSELGALNVRIRAELYRRGNGMVAATKVDGTTWLKVTLLNPLAGVDDITGILREICTIGAQLAPVAEVA